MPHALFHFSVFLTPSVALQASTPIYLSRTSSNTASSTKLPPPQCSARTDCFLFALNKICIYPFNSAYSAQYLNICRTYGTPLYCSLKGTQCPISHLCPTPHSFLNRTLVSVAQSMVDKQPTGAASCPACSQSLSC